MAITNDLIKVNHALHEYVASLRLNNGVLTLEAIILAFIAGQRSPQTSGWAANLADVQHSRIGDDEHGYTNEWQVTIPGSGPVVYDREETATAIADVHNSQACGGCETFSRIMKEM